MINFERFWLQGNGPYEDEATEFDEAPPGVTAEEIRAWEDERGVTLPEPLRTALGLRNGGYVRNTGVEILPLGEMVPVDDDFWDHTELDEDEAEDRSLLFVFGSDMNGGTLLMNFNAQGPEGPPSVYVDYHGESTDRLDDAIGDFFEGALRSDDAPSVDWSEAEASTDVIARETIDYAHVYGGKPASEEQVLVRKGAALVLFTRRRSPLGESLTRTELPLPLDAEQSQIRPFGGASTSAFALHLQPLETSGIVETTSETTEDGRWKNSTSYGVPIYAPFRSTDQGRLEALREPLFGAEDAARARAAQIGEAAFLEALDRVPPDQRAAEMMQAWQAMKAELDRQFAAKFDDLGPPPPEVADALTAIERIQKEMLERAKKPNPMNILDPETLRRMQDFGE
jgi:hypothetical protein